jgi:hypothetical protein
MKAFVDSVGGTPPRIVSHPIGFGSGEWTCVIGEFEDGSRMVSAAKWRDGAICRGIYLELMSPEPERSAR